MEYRQFNIPPMLATADDESVIATVVGCAAPFESWSYDLEQRRLTEKIIKGAFGKIIRLIKNGRKVVHAYVNHNPKQKLSDTRRGLRLRETNEGLFYQLDLFDNPLGRAMKRLVSEKKISGVSIGYKKVGETSNITKRKPSVAVGLPAISQEGLATEGESMDGSDVIEGAGEGGADRWQVLRTVDLQELSLLTQGERPAYRCTSAELEGSAAEEARRLQQLARVYDVLAI